MAAGRDGCVLPQMGWGARALCDTGGDGVGPGLRDLLEMIVRRRVQAGGGARGSPVALVVYRRSSWISGGGAFGRRLLSDGGACCEGLMPRFLMRGWLLSLPFCVWR